MSYVMEYAKEIILQMK